MASLRCRLMPAPRRHGCTVGQHGSSERAASCPRRPDCTRAPLRSLSPVFGGHNGARVAMGLSRVVVVLSCGMSVIASADAMRFADIEGEYTSSIHGGCELLVRRNATFELKCQACPVCRGRAVDFGSSFGFLCGQPADGSVQEQNPQGPRRGPASPPAVRDPTRGPYVMHPSDGSRGRTQRTAPGGEFYWLEPFRWGDRLYLIRDGDYETFCRSIRVGVEPRKTAAGEQFLRRGDHVKRVHPKEPAECTAFK
jgi:hypothetical protein